MSSKSKMGILAAACSLIVPAAAWAMWPERSWPAVVLALWALAAAAFVVVLDRRSERRRHRRTIERMRRTAIDTLSHHRHDWMNELQILYGYLRLNKPDKAIAVVDRIKRRMEHDSRISRLGSPELAAFLLSFRTMCDTMRLEVDVDEDCRVDRAGREDDRLTAAVVGIVNAFRFRAASSAEEENVLRLRFCGVSADGGEAGDGIRLELIYEGKLAAETSLEAEMKRVLDGFGRWAEERPAEGDPASRRRMVVVFPQAGQAV